MHCFYCDTKKLYIEIDTVKEKNGSVFSFNE